MEDWSAGEWGGAFAGLVAGLAALGKGAAWLLDWNRTGLTRREERLASWEQSLASRERNYREEIESQLASARTEIERVEAEVGQLRSVLSEVTGELLRLGHDSPILARAVRALGMG